MKSAKADHSPRGTAQECGAQGIPCLGQSYLERLGVLHMEQIRLTILTELYMREMSIRQFYETVGGTSYDTVRRHFLKLVEYGWLRKVRTAQSGRGRPEGFYRATELAVIDTETWRTLPVSVRDALTVQTLEEMGRRLGEALDRKTADARRDVVATFKTMEVDEAAWCSAMCAIEHCFQALLQEQTDAKIRIKDSSEQPITMAVNLVAFEAVGAGGDSETAGLPKASRSLPLSECPERIGKLFGDGLDLQIVDELNRAAMTPAQLRATLGGASGQGFLRRCRRLEDLGWAVNVDTRTGGELYGASVHQFRAAAPDVSESDIVGRIPRARRNGRSWDAFRPFVEASIQALKAGTFNSRVDRHMTESALLVDEIGWTQVTTALQSFERKLRMVEAGLARRRRTESFAGFEAGFLVSSFQSPPREGAK